VAASTSLGLSSFELRSIKAELLQEGIFFLIHLFARDVLVMKKLEIQKTIPTFIISVFKVEYQVVLVSSISNFFTHNTYLANKWVSGSSNLALDLKNFYN
jgi:hypothetical protein